MEGYFQTNLDDAQQALLLELVDAQESLPRDKRQHFLLSQTFGGEAIVHPGADQSRGSYESDLRELADEDYIWIDRPGRNLRFDITNRGYAHARELRAQVSAGIDQVEAEVMRYVSAAGFSQRHPAAAAKLRSAARALAQVPVEPSAVGHHCREAFQEFAHGITREAVPAEKARQAKNRLRAAVESRRNTLGKRRTEWLDALIVYTDAVIALTQRQEHIGTAATPPDPEDARIVVFQTAVALYEFDRMLRFDDSPARAD